MDEKGAYNLVKCTWNEYKKNRRAGNKHVENMVLWRDGIYGGCPGVF